jgi:hypothetical protein
VAGLRSFYPPPLRLGFPWPAWRAAVGRAAAGDSAIELCRTAALGGHVEWCGDCGHQRAAYNSCRNRNSPKCQSPARAKCLGDRQAELLDVPYCLIVFTVPHEIEVIAFHNQTVVHDILFRAASETLREIAADPKHLGAKIGFLVVLHTWGKTCCITRICTASCLPGRRDAHAAMFPCVFGRGPVSRRDVCPRSRSTLELPPADIGAADCRLRPSSTS